MSGEAAAAAPRAGSPAHPIRSDLQRLAKLAAPVVASRVGIMTMGLTDTIVVGRHSAEQLGFLALGWAVSSSVLSSALGLLSGVQVMASRSLGEGRPHAAGAALRRGLVYGLWIGLVAAVVLAFGGPALLAHLGLKGNLAAGSAAPLIILAISMPSFAISSASSSWLEGLGRTTPPMLLMWAANFLNLGVDLVLVPGGFGLPAMGAAGAATATFSARTFIALATLIYIALMKDSRRLGVFERPTPSRPVEIEQRRVGYGAAASAFFETSAFASMNVIAGWIGPLAVAAWAVVLNMAALIFMVPLGLATATAVMVSRSFGAGDTPGLQRAGLLGFGLAAAFGVAIGLVIWPTASILAPVFTSDPKAIAMAAGALVLSCLFFLPDALQVVAAQALRARGDVLVPTFTHLASYIAVMLPLGYLLALPLHMGLTGVVVAVIIASFVSAGLLLGRFALLARWG
ncbi:MAG TPA: MATE family efflux transporter [Caulobacteraceae bacterium]|jgi:MATE family multidrug resistance protein|nr:MATE family efflux transporter [Caulobacteraceae bacterium]